MRSRYVNVHKRWSARVYVRSGTVPIGPVLPSLATALAPRRSRRGGS
jgi:hypothetical protein